jgi:hypothetical protein
LSGKLLRLVCLQLWLRLQSLLLLLLSLLLSMQFLGLHPNIDSELLKAVLKSRGIIVLFKRLG